MPATRLVQQYISNPVSRNKFAFPHMVYVYAKLKGEKRRRRGKDQKQCINDSLKTPTPAEHLVNRKHHTELDQLSNPSQYPSTPPQVRSTS